MKIFTCIIIDDQAYAIEGLKKYINSMPSLKLIKSYTDPQLALIELPSSKGVDIIFLDVDMPFITGIELSKEIRPITKMLIFTTAHTKYGYEAFQAQADAYLLKPYSLAKFTSTVMRLLPNQEEEVTAQHKDDFFLVKNSEDDLKIVKIEYGDVIAVESKQNYVMIYTKTQKVLTYMSLTEIFQMLNQHLNFIQFHRSYIIGKSHIVSIVGNTINMVNGLNITVGEFYRKEFNAFLSNNLIKAGRKK